MFIAPDTGITRVSFYFDNPNMAGTPSKVENVIHISCDEPRGKAGNKRYGSATVIDQTLA